MNPKERFLKRIHLGLSRRSLVKCSEWALRYRMMGKPFPGRWTFDYHPWLREMHDSKAEENVGQKSAQAGYTETMLNFVFFNIDINQESALYLLPTNDDASDFSASRFDPALELSPHLRGLFSSVKNVGLKRAGSATLYVRGSKSKSRLKSIPAAILAFDELDEMDPAMITLAEERGSGQMDTRQWYVSTPTLPEQGINKKFLESTQEYFFFKCPHCSRQITLDMVFKKGNVMDEVASSLVITAEDHTDPAIRNSYYRCIECGARLEQAEKPYYLSDGIFVPKRTDAMSRGFYVNQLYSYTVSPYEIAIKYLKSLYDPAEEQELHNSKLGRAHVVAGGRIEDYEMDARIANFPNKFNPASTNIRTMGIDVGTWLHFWIDEWIINPHIDINTGARCRSLYIGKVAEFELLDDIIKNWRINHFVIDGNPERRKAIELCNRFYGMGSICFYGKNVKGRTLNYNEEQNAVTVDRTSWLDVSLGRFKKAEQIALPSDFPLEARSHIKNIAKLYKKNNDGEIIAKYVNGSKDDHFAHSRNYSEIALPLAIGYEGNENIEGVTWVKKEN